MTKEHSSQNFSKKKTILSKNTSTTLDTFIHALRLLHALDDFIHSWIIKSLLYKPNKK